MDDADLQYNNRTGFFCFGWPAKSKLQFRQYQGERSLVLWIQHFLVLGCGVSLSLSWGQGVKVNHTLSMLHGRAASHNATATPSIADQYSSDHLYDYLCKSGVVPWRCCRWVLMEVGQGEKNEERKGRLPSQLET
jgi:hypothetical protein